jgi:hypothetical protein
MTRFGMKRNLPVMYLFVADALFWHFGGYSMIEEKDLLTIDMIVGEIVNDIEKNTDDTPFTVTKGDFIPQEGPTFNSEPLSKHLQKLLTKIWDNENYKEYSEQVFLNPEEDSGKEKFFKLCNHALPFVLLHKDQTRKQREIWLKNLTHNLFSFGKGNFVVGCIRFVEPFLLKQEIEKKQDNFDQNLLKDNHQIVMNFLSAVVGQRDSGTKKFLTKEFDHFFALARQFRVDGLYDNEIDLADELLEKFSMFYEFLQKNIDTEGLGTESLKNINYATFYLLFVQPGSYQLRHYLQSFHDYFFEKFFRNLTDNQYATTLSESKNIFDLEGVQAYVNFVSFINALTKEDQKNSDLAWFVSNLTKFIQKAAYGKDNIASILIAIAVGASISIRDSSIYKVSLGTRNTFVELLRVIKDRASADQIKLLKEKITGDSVIQLVKEYYYFVDCFKEAGLEITEEKVKEKVVVKQHSYFSRLKTFAKKHPYQFAGGVALGLSGIIIGLIFAKYKKLRLPTRFWK